MKKTLHMIGNAHIDPVWLWRWQDGCSTVRSTFRSALDRMNEFEDFVFTCAAGSYYEWIEKIDPPMFEEIRARVKEGRWKIVGGWWIQPDCNIPAGESFARQALYAQRYFQEKFGITVETGYNVDSFGHNGMLPKILRKSGMKQYVYMRPGVHEKSYPAWTYRWQSPEGEWVTAFRIPFEYCTWGDTLPSHIQRCADEISDENGMMCFYGVGNHGGGPTKENLRLIGQLNGQNGLELKLSDPDQFFAGVDSEKLPVVNGDLLHHASGCYAAHSGVKRWNRQAEHRLLSAEKWSVAAQLLLGKAYPTEQYREAWKKVLFNQFHDILAGCCIREAYEDAREDFSYALSVGAHGMNEAQQALMSCMEIPFHEGAFQYVAFNPHGFAAHAPVSLEVQAYSQPMCLIDDAGHEIPFQLAPGSAAARGRKQLHFEADVPAMGWRVYTMLPAQTDAAPYEESRELRLENDEVLALFDEQCGLYSLKLKTSDSEMLRGGAQALVADDPSDTWSHGVLRFDAFESEMKVRSVRVVQDGPVFKTIRVEYGDADSSLVQYYTLYRHTPQLFVRCRLLWNKHQKLLKWHLPLNIRYGHVCAQAPFGYADRDMYGVEYPMHAYVDVTGVAKGQEDPQTGLAVLNDGKYAYSAVRDALDITLCRSPYYANHEPFVVEDGMEYPCTDEGVQEFTLALLPHCGSLQQGGVEEAALLLNAPVTLLPESAHAGKLGRHGSVLELRAKHAVLDAVKAAEDGRGIIVHMHETARAAEEAVLALPLAGQEIPVSFTPGEIRALRICLPDFTVEETDLIESAARS